MNEGYQIQIYGCLTNAWIYWYSDFPTDIQDILQMSHRQINGLTDVQTHTPKTYGDIYRHTNRCRNIPMDVQMHKHTKRCTDRYKKVPIALHPSTCLPTLKSLFKLISYS